MNTAGTRRGPRKRGTRRSEGLRIAARIARKKETRAKLGESGGTRNRCFDGAAQTVETGIDVKHVASVELKFAFVIRGPS